MTVATLDQPLPLVVRVAGVQSLWRDIAVMAFLLWWITFSTWGVGGQQPRLLSISAALLLVAELLVRPWERVPSKVTWAVNSVGMSAFAVAALAPTGWAGAGQAASYAVASQAGLLIFAWASDPARRLIVLAVVVAGGLFEFAQGYIAWWAGGYSDKVFVGTFYWHNQTGAFLATSAAVALPLVIFRVRGVEGLCWLSLPLCVAGLRYTTSRASQLALMGAAVGVLVMCLWRLRQGARSSAGLFARLAGLALAASAAIHFLSGRPFFATHATGIADTYRDQSIATNAGHRLEFWHQAWRNFLHWPLTGAGFDSFANATKVVTPDYRALSAYAHSGLFQALNDGGLLLGVPLVGLLLGLVVALVRRVISEPRDPVGIAAALGTVVLLAHSLVDFDWTYPALLTYAAVLGGVATAGRQPCRRSTLHWPAAFVSVVVLVLSVAVAWKGLATSTLPLQGGTA